MAVIIAGDRRVDAAFTLKREEGAGVGQAGRVRGGLGAASALGLAGIVKAEVVQVAGTGAAGPTVGASVGGWSGWGGGAGNRGGGGVGT